jgi:arginine decarboxylase
VLCEDGTGAGLFVEHEGTSRAQVEGDIRASLADLAAGRPGEFSEPHLELTSATCEGEPTCALVVAAYETAGWARA